MFDQLRKAFSNAVRNVVQKELTEKDINNILLDLEISLLQSDVSQEVIDDLALKLKADLVGLKLEKGQNAENIINMSFRNIFDELFSKVGEIDLLQKIKEKKDKKTGPFVIVFLGINGTGKTTTVAKMAYLLRKNNISVVLAASDTHRAGAIEQLSRHAERLSLKVIAQRYGADPSAVGRDAVDYARKHHVDVVLVDTAGRMQTAKNLMDEINKIVRVVKPDAKLFVGDALAGNDTINQAREFFQYTNFDGAILTKIDADAKGGAAISIVYITSKPIVYLGIGQGYDDVVSFDYKRFVDSIFRDTPLANTSADVRYPPSKKNPSSDDNIEYMQQSEKHEAIELSEKVVVSSKTDEFTQLEDPHIEEEDQGLSESQSGQGKFTLPTSDMISSAPNSSAQSDLSTKVEEGVIGEREIKGNIDNEIKNSKPGNLDEIEQITRSSSTSPTLSAETDHSDKVNNPQEKNKKTRFRGLFCRWKKDRNERAEDQT